MNEPIGCTKCGGSDHNADECKRFAGDLVLDRGWPDRDYWCKCCGCGEMFTGHKRQMICRVCTEESAAQPAPVVPEGFKALLDRIVPRLDAGGPNPIDPEIHHCEWTLYQERERIHAEFAAAPAQGQQVECQECERLRMQLVACGVVALANTPESAAKARDVHPDYMSASCQDVMRAVDSEIALRAKLSALKAQQVGQEPTVKDCLTVQPVAYAVFAENGNIRIWCSDPIQAETLRQQYGAELRPLYTAPQPAPSQDVAGWIPERKETGEWESARIADFNSGWNACLDEVVALLGKAAWMELDTTNRSISIQDEIRSALAAHDKQSGGEV